jgi:taurine dioxygenase
MGEAMSGSNRMSVTPLNPTIGAVIGGLDLADDHADGVIDDIRGALLDHKVLFFEDQDLSPERQRDFAARFGELHIHPLYPETAGVPEIMVLDNHEKNPTDNDHWHTDVTFLERPALGAILHARILPPSGGDTLWSSMTASYDALSAPMRAFLDGLSAVHDLAYAFAADGIVAGAAGREAYEKARRENPPVIHPVVRTHPETGRNGLFVNSGFTVRIKGLRHEESRAVLDFLHRHIQKPEFCVRWNWRPWLGGVLGQPMHPALRGQRLSPAPPRDDEGDDLWRQARLQAGGVRLDLRSSAGSSAPR